MRSASLASCSSLPYAGDQGPGSAGADAIVRWGVSHPAPSSRRHCPINLRRERVITHLRGLGVNKLDDVVAVEKGYVLIYTAFRRWPQGDCRRGPDLNPAARTPAGFEESGAHDSRGVR